MSFLNKIKGWTPNDGVAADAVSTATFADAALPADASVNASAVFGPAFALPAGPAEHSPALPGFHATTDIDMSIISEAAPSEMADFAETRVPDNDLLAAAAAAGTGLPLIGRRPVAEQQRVLVLMVGLGVLGLILMTVLLLVSANRGAAQVGAGGQALMQ